MRLIHVINPVLVPAGSGGSLARAQPVTFEALRRALLCARTISTNVDVELVAALFPEDLPALPLWMAEGPAPVAVRTLSRALPDFTDIRPARKLPLIADVLRAARPPDDPARADHAWVVYTNMDIAPQPFFYELIASLARDHPGGFIITRRNIATDPSDPAEIARMYADGGERCYGFDTFAFPARYLPDLVLESEKGGVHVGLPFIDEAVMANLDALSGFRAAALKYLHATFHLGNDMEWSRSEPLCRFNHERCAECMRALIERHPDFPAGSELDRVQAKILGGRARSKSLGARLKTAFRRR